MMKIKYKRLIFLFLIICLTGFLSCVDKKPTYCGFLKGSVSIGPLCPVERIPPDPGCLPTAETYKAYQVDVYSYDGDHIITKISPSTDGKFITELPQGNYKINMEKVIVIGGSNLPSFISINQNDTTFFDIVIDTGIR